MPIFEFKCESCGKEFERLVFASDTDPVPCPICGSEKTRKVLSVFSSNAVERQASAGSCGTRHSGGG